MNRLKLIGSTRITFELHSFHGDQWLVVKDGAELRQIEPAAALLVQRGEVDGIRLVRRVDYLDHGFSATVTLVKRLRAGVQEADPLMRANPGRDASWCDRPEDLLGDVQRQVMRGLLSKYLEEKRLTPLEVLHYEVHAKALDQAGTTVQGALQRLASQQVRGTKQTAVARMKELISLVDAALASLVKAGRGALPVSLQAGGFKAVADSLEGPPETVSAVLYRAAAAYLLPARTWVEKLDMLFRLWEPDLTVREMRILDSLAAEIMASPLALKELAGKERNRLELVTNAIDLYSGRMGKPDVGGEQPPGVKVLSILLAEGVLPRTMAELRHGLLRHLHSRLPLRAEARLREEMRATVEVRNYLRTKAPLLARDEEVLEALALRADRLIQPEAMAELMTGCRTLGSRINAVLDLIEEVPGESPKAKLAPYLRSLISPEDMIRECGNRAEAISILGEVARRIGAGLSPVLGREMLESLDSAIFDSIRTEILGNTSSPFADRILMLLRLCGGLPEGRARQLASDTLTQALKRPEFILNYLERFPGAADRRNAYHKLCGAILDSGLVDKALVPTAA